jgi:V-type H+-transporting ATPase subunit C
MLVEGVPVDRFLTAFQWDEAKHPHRRPLKETIENISAGVALLDEDLKVCS